MNSKSKYPPSQNLKLLSKYILIPDINLFTYTFICQSEDFPSILRWWPFYLTIYLDSSSSSSCHAISADIPDPISPPPIVHCFRQVFRTTPRIGTEPLYVGSSWSSCLCSSMWRGPQEYITYELVLTSPAVSRMSGSSNFDSFRYGWEVAVQLLLCGVLPPGLVQYCSQHSGVIAVKLFLYPFS